VYLREETGVYPGVYLREETGVYLGVYLGCTQGGTMVGISFPTIPRVVPWWVYTPPTIPTPYTPGYTTVYTAELRTVSAVQGCGAVRGDEVLGSNPRLIWEMRRIEALVLP